MRLWRSGVLFGDLGNRWRVLLAAAAGAGFLGPASAEVFDDLGVTPEEAAVALANLPHEPRQGISGFGSSWVGWTMTPEHRESFLEALATHSDVEFRWRRVAATRMDLLEEAGRHEEAMAVLAEPTAFAGFEFEVRRVGLLWKSGRREEARDAALKLDFRESAGSGWYPLVAVDLAMGRTAEAMSLLDFLIGLEGLSPKAHHLAVAQQIELACRHGWRDRLLEADAPPLLRALRLRMVGEEGKADEIIKPLLPAMNGRDLARWLVAAPSGPDSERRWMEVMADPATPQAVKVGLIEITDAPMDQMRRIFLMKAGHREVLPEVMGRWLNYGSMGGTEFFKTSDELVATDPADPWFRALRIHCTDTRDPLREEDLKVIARSAPTNPDLASWAIGGLVGRMDVAELDAWVTGARDYLSLGLADQVRRLTAGQLDGRLAELLAAADFRGKDGGTALDLASSYFSQRTANHEIPGVLVDTVTRRLPDLVLGSGGDAETLIGARLERWCGLISSRRVDPEALAPAIRRVHDELEARGIRRPESILARVPEAWRTAAGLPARLPSKAPRASLRGEGVPVWLNALRLFNHPAAWVKQGNGEWGFPAADIGSNVITESHLRRHPLVQLIIRSPWTCDLLVNMPHPRMQEDATGIALRLRSSLPDDAVRARWFDAAVASGLLEVSDGKTRDRLKGWALRSFETPAAEPEIAVYLAGTVLADSGRNPPDLKSCTIATRQMIRTSLLLASRPMNRGGRPEAARPDFTALIDRLALDLPPPREPERGTVEDAVMARLAANETTGNWRTREGIAFAGEVLDRFIDSRRTSARQEEIRAMTQLRRAGVLEEYVEGWKRAAVSGHDGKQAARALFLLHQPAMGFDPAERIPFARRLFEIDPSMMEAAGIVLHDALSRRDAPVVRECVLQMARHSARTFDQAIVSPEVWELLVGADFEGYLDELMKVPFAWGFEPDGSARLAFVRRCIGIAPERLGRLMRWARMETVGAETQFMELLEALVDAGQRELATEAAARRLIPLDDDGGGVPRRFKARLAIWGEGPPHPPYETLDRLGILEPLAGIAGGRELRDLNHLRILLAADPRAETWNGLIRPALDAATDTDRLRMTGDLARLLQQVPEGRNLLAVFTVDKIREGGKPDPDEALEPAVRFLAESMPDDRREIASRLWDALKARANADGSQSFAGMTVPFARIADDEDWMEFLEMAEKEQGFARRSLENQEPVMDGAADDRLRDLFRLILAKPGETRSMGAAMAGWMAAMVDAGFPPDELAEYSRWLEGLPPDELLREPWSSLRIVTRLAMGDLSAVQPFVVAEAAENGAFRVRWVLSGMQGEGGRVPLYGRYPGIEGKFDVQVLAGPEKDQLKRVALREQAECRDEMVLEFPAGARHVAVLATSREGADVHYSGAFPIHGGSGWRPVEWNADPLPAGLTRSPVTGSGPFMNQDGWEWVCRGNAEWTLGGFDWEGGEAPVVRAWAIGDSNVAGRLHWVFLDQEGREVGESRLTGSTGSGALNWQFIEGQARPSPGSAGAVRIELRARSFVTQGRHDRIRMVGFEFRRPEPLPLPEAIRRIGRIQAPVSAMNWNPGSRLMTVGTHDGRLAVLDPETGRAGEWVGLVTPGPEDADGSTLVWTGAAGDRTLAITAVGEVLWKDGARGKVHGIRLFQNLGGIDTRVSNAALSRDGRFLAASTSRGGCWIIEVQGNGGSERRKLPIQGEFHVGFDEAANEMWASDHSRTWTVPLDDWRKGEPKVTSGPCVPHSGSFDLGSRGEIRFGDREVAVRTGVKPELVVADGQVKTLILPSGKVAWNEEGSCWWIDPTGQVHRIRL